MRLGEYFLFNARTSDAFLKAVFDVKKDKRLQIKNLAVICIIFNGIEMDEKIIGVISDTHNLLRPEAVKMLSGSNLIIHAGDIGSEQILEELRKIAPLIVVRGNNDKENWARNLPVTEEVKIKTALIYIIHDIKEMNSNPACFNVVISGHSHKPSVEDRKGILYLNPGSAGPRRFRLPVSAARLKISDNKIEAKIIKLLE